MMELRVAIAIIVFPGRHRGRVEHGSRGFRAKPDAQSERWFFVNHGGCEKYEHFFFVVFVARGEREVNSF
jgi:hypothetical protein